MVRGEGPEGERKVSKTKARGAGPLKEQKSSSQEENLFRDARRRGGKAAKGPGLSKLVAETV